MFKHLKSYFLIILASVCIGVTVAHPIAPHLLSECMYKQVSGAYSPYSSSSDQWNTCLMQPQVIAVGTAVVASFLLALWFRRRLFDGISVKQLAITSIVYGVLQFLSLIFLQSHHLFDAQQAVTFKEIVINYWFAVDAVVFYLLAAIVSQLAFSRRSS
jgi:hypothetical protein